ncbi:MAG: hypothetical protein LBG46_06210 [Elusimicrobiota bacterium]|jgi:hypothetical protein|nr:hypothetical protein [Elusimicrobiota bacterium]
MKKENKFLIFLLLCFIFCIGIFFANNKTADKVAGKPTLITPSLEELKQDIETLKREINDIKSSLSEMQNFIKKDVITLPTPSTTPEAVPSAETFDSNEQMQAGKAYDIVATMLKDAIAFREKTGREPRSLDDLGGDYHLAGFRADINHNGPSLFRVENGRDRYRIHFIAPYSYIYDKYPNIRKICDSENKEDFINICGFLAGKDFSNEKRNEYGYFRTGL